MSRIGKQPITLPAGVEASVSGNQVSIKGPKGQLELNVHPFVTVQAHEEEGTKQLLVTMEDLSSKFKRAIWGTVRALIQNMVTGVTTGFSKNLEINGVGYKVALAGNTLKLSLGYSHDVEYVLPAGITAEVEKNTITLHGADRQLVGHTAAEIRKLRKPEPYKGKGIKYADETIRRKAGKAAKAA